MTHLKEPRNVDGDVRKDPKDSAWQYREIKTAVWK